MRVATERTTHGLDASRACDDTWRWNGERLASRLAARAACGLTSRADMARRVLIITPTYNERENLRTFLDRVFAVAADVNVLVIDDNSPDGTGQLADEIAASDRRVNVLHRPGKMASGARTSPASAAPSTSATTSCSRWTPTSRTTRSTSRVPACDRRRCPDRDRLAQHSRRRRRGWGPTRHIISKGGSLYSRTILGLGVHDLTSGYKAFTRQASKRSTSKA